MNTENTKAQMRKGILEFCILSLINDREMYVSDLIEELKNGKLDVVEGTLYPLLTRLKNGEFLSYRWEESTGGPPRKYYQMTEKGGLFLTELQNTWKELTESVDQITKNNNPANDAQSTFQPNS
ncbi:transcriptional regulator, PadR family [Kaistella treverensis]|uniref:Transcriptional regulator, PadR family n=1 Tax=Kaistella treverensis TaxID=631455 RepID=A0A1I3NW07_9FLAO|nr:MULTISPECIES: PadR family transcriptional regulator [Kaistella]SFJ13302.1 transcriptional regulator, PadR family [Kaistella treverensis]